MILYRKGDLITTSVPYVFALSSSERALRCDFCFQCSNSSPDVKLKRCSNCKLFFFCNIQCQRNAWKLYHKAECSRLSGYYPEKIPTETFIFFTRLVYRIVLKKEAAVSEDVCNVSRSFIDLESHVEELSKDNRRKEQLGTLEQFLREIFPETRYNQEDLLSIFGKMVINTYAICDSETCAIGTGLYLGASIFDHSCDPNAVAVFNGTTMHIRAIKDFHCHSHKDVFISYIDTLEPTCERQKRLREQYYFTCQCCSCLNSSTDKIKTEILEPMGCSEFLGQVSEFIREFTSKRSSLSVEQKRCLLDQCSQKLKHCEACLGEGHVYKIRLLDMAFDLCIDQQLWKESLDFALPTIEYYKRYYNKYHPLVGIQLFKIGKVLNLTGKLSEAKDVFLETKEILSVCYGNDHKFIDDLNCFLYQCQEELASKGLLHLN